MVCEIPFTTLDELAGSIPKLRQQIFRLMSEEINTDQQMLHLLNKKTAEQRVATFFSNLSNYFNSRGFSSTEFQLSMTRSEIGNYLGLTVETVSRIMSKLQKQEVIHAQGKMIKLLDLELLQDTCGS